jgi:NTP pyrophosphatase (non-canonical NTP hydrolase)
MLDTRQFLLTKLAEECNEVAQRALKQQQFGRYEKQPGQEKTNSQRLFEEIIDLTTVISLLEKAGELPVISLNECEDRADAKIKKIQKYRQYSQNLGYVEPETCLRCGVGRDNDQDGNCNICHNLPDAHAADIKATR